MAYSRCLRYLLRTVYEACPIGDCVSNFAENPLIAQHEFGTNLPLALFAISILLNDNDLEGRGESLPGDRDSRGRFL